MIFLWLLTTTLSTVDEQLNRAGRNGPVYGQRGKNHSVDVDREGKTGTGRLRREGRSKETLYFATRGPKLFVGYHRCPAMLILGRLCTAIIG